VGSKGRKDRSDGGAALGIAGRATGRVGDRGLALSDDGLAVNAKLLRPNDPGFPTPAAPDDRLTTDRVDDLSSLDRRHEFPTSIGHPRQHAILPCPGPRCTARHQIAGPRGRTGRRRNERRTFDDRAEQQINALESLIVPPLLCACPGARNGSSNRAV
jgi:hypothetical protein